MVLDFRRPEQTMRLMTMILSQSEGMIIKLKGLCFLQHVCLLADHIFLY
jgi:hypothetical protein